jgi:hypothetical protein
MKTAARGSEVCAFTKVLTDLASSIRRGGSMRVHWVLPTMRVVTEERPLTEAMWWWVWRGVVGFFSLWGTIVMRGFVCVYGGVYERLEFVFQRTNG